MLLSSSQTQRKLEEAPRSSDSEYAKVSTMAKYCFQRNSLTTEEFRSTSKKKNMSVDYANPNTLLLTGKRECSVYQLNFEADTQKNVWTHTPQVLTMR